MFTDEEQKDYLYRFTLACFVLIAATNTQFQEEVLPSPPNPSPREFGLRLTAKATSTRPNSRGEGSEVLGVFFTFLQPRLVVD